MIDNIKVNVKNILEGIPENIMLVAAVKTQSAEKIISAIDAGIKILGENYIQEAEEMFKVVGKRVKWHFIGHLQKNKIKKAVNIFDMIETVDSIELAKNLDNKCADINRIMPILIEVNSAKELNKSGVFPEKIIDLIREISVFKHIKIAGLMTMGPVTENTEEIRPYFKLVKNLFDEILALKIDNIEMRYLSMGMSDSYQIAIQEGANIVRIGTKIFGARLYK
ncbi:pyridoxal phosphate enzyme, YggS family [Candidatus Omnitrophus magneticus]|uniref:Pyridoxal phosphate homeostasis protein n=1 Tax=Candidatus Omnitrophus magneticus TaxID=1609969 RepID=A0A0F0CS52_9BACT|nr:pyridoxal phosphate enzyme, YggS family [Candidatus Omnitrophus magneticus]